MRRAHMIAAIVGMILAVAYTAGALRYANGTAAEPGPGFFPLCIGIFWIVASFGFTLGTRSKKEGQDQMEWPKRVGWYRVAGIVGACILYLTLLELVGDAIAGGLTSLVVLQTMGGFRWYTKIGAAAAMGLGCYVLFDMILKVPMPRGIWFT